MKLKIDKKDCLSKDLKIPKGYRLLEDYELLKELRTNKELYELAKDSWIWVNTATGTIAAGFNYYNVEFLVNGVSFIGYQGCSRGVFVKKGADEE